MKNILFVSVFLFLSMNGQAQKSVRKFYHKVNRSEETVKMTLPGFLIHMGAGIARKQVDEEPEAKLALEMTKYIKSIKIVVAEDQSTISQDDYSKFIDIARNKDKFSDLIMVKDGETNVNIMMRGNSRKIKNLLILVNDGDEFVMLSMKTSLKYKDLNKFLKAIMLQNKKIKVMPKETKNSVKKAIDRA